MIQIAILGYGGRGRCYAQLTARNASYKLVAVIDNSAEKREAAKTACGLTDAAIFSSLDDFLAKEKCADMVMVCTQDRDHKEHAIKCLEAGYDLLLEKPIAATPEDCIAIEQTALRLNRNVSVCHVLRYSSFFRKFKEIIDSGILGDIVSVEQTENVGYWHQAHSFVRGDWRNAGLSTPMIIAKCCHDLDIIQYLAGAPCGEVTSLGKLHNFKKENAPKGATPMCMGGCAAKETCPYDAEKLYIKTLRRLPRAAWKHAWPQSRLIANGLVTMPKLQEAVQNGQFGRCVYLCDNDVVDYQQVSMRFQNGVQASLTMTAFSEECYRTLRVRGTLGEIYGDMRKTKAELHIFGKKKTKIRTALHSFDAHGGGDSGMIRALGSGKTDTDITASIESHLIGFAAETSRQNGGAPVDVAAFKKRLLS